MFVLFGLVISFFVFVCILCIIGFMVFFLEIRLLLVIMFLLSKFLIVEYKLVEIVLDCF